jgi:hypothetical protein
MVGECTTEKRTNNACKSEYTTKGTKEERALIETGDLCEDGQDGEEDTRSADTLECTCEDEDVHAGGDTTEE